MKSNDDYGEAYYLIEDSDGDDPKIIIDSRTKFLCQYFKYVRSGAVRIEAGSGNDDFDPLAFINSNGKYVVIVKANAGGPFCIKGLPAGTYGIEYALQASATLIYQT